MPSPVRTRCIPVLAIGLLFLFAVSNIRAQQTINVPASQPSIQAAINTANNGDTVLVAPGTYVENINFGGKAITVTSSSGPSVTILDGGANGSVVTFSTGETPNSVLSGFTIRNGFQNGLSGGGIYIVAASPTITGNVITANHAAAGCGIYVGGGSPLIENNTITANDQTGAGDGGQGGGGILVSGSSSPSAAPQIIGNTITNNSVANGGDGGGISVQYLSSPLIQGNLIQGNTAYNFGGGVALESENSLILVQNLIVNNISQGGGSGAGLYVSPYSVPTQTTITNNTIAANSAFDFTSGIYVNGFGQYATFTNNVVVAPVGQNAVTCNSGFSPVSPVFSHNDAFTAQGTAWAGICNTTSNPGNISADPLFMSAANGDFHLQAGSPAIDAGDSSVSNLPNTDFDGNPRIVGTIDLGVYEVVNTSTATLSPNNLSFGPQMIGTSSAPQYTALSSTGTTAFQITSFQVTSGFSVTTNCPALAQPGGFSGVQPGTSCIFTVSFTPTATPDPSGYVPIGPLTGTLTVNGTNGSSLVVSLSGTALAQNSDASVSPGYVQFGLQQVGTSSPAQPVTLTNLGAPALSIASIAITQQYSETDNCPSSLAGGASCTINITFTPTATGTVNGTLTITDNSYYGSPQRIALNGQGGAANANLSLSGINFGNQLLNSTSSPINATLSNTGSLSLTLNSISASGDFAQTNNCPSSLAPNASCVITITFTPTALGGRTGSVTITDNSYLYSPQVITLNGTGITPAAVSLSSSSLTFSGQVIGTTSPTQTVTLTNTGSVSLNISGIAATLPFAQANNCPASLAGNASCTISVTFTPQSPGNATGGVTITDNAGGSPQSIALSGTGLAPAAVSLSPSSLAFASQVIGTSSAAQTITLTNTGGASLTITSLAASQPFAQTNNCPASLAGNASCTISVTFTPQSPGNATGGVTITDSASGSPQSVTLTGTGLTPAAVSLSPSSLAFGNQVIGTTSAAQMVTLTNTGGGSLSISSMAASQPFAQTNNCPPTLAGGATCTISVTFTPQTASNANGGIPIFDNASGSPQTITLSGTGLTPAAASLSPSSLSFSTPLGRSSAPQTLTVTNTGGAALDISSVAATLPFVVYSNNCSGPPLAGGASCTITIAFTPQSNANVTGTFTITDSAANSPQSVALSGTTPANVALSPSSLTFSGQTIGTTSAAQTVTLSNTGASSLAISNIATSQPFAQTNNCPATLAGGASCSINVAFTPTARGSASGTLQITDTASGSPQSITVSGTGLAPAAVSFNPVALSFGSFIVGTSSSASPVTLTNSGDISLNISSILTNASFMQTNNCPATLAGGATCTISVTFTPQASGQINGALSVIDSAAGSPHTVSLSGTGLDFTVSASPSSVSVSAGSAASYTALVNPAGGPFNQSVSLSCSGLPAFSTCSFSPTAVTPGSSGASASLKIQTTRHGNTRTPAGTYAITITGTSGNLVRNTNATLVVN